MVDVPRNSGYEGLIQVLLEFLYGPSVDGSYFKPYENSTFAIRPYQWECGCADWYEHDVKTCRLELPNFEFKPTGYTLSWYKYPLRGASASWQISLLQFFTMIASCIKSLEARNSTG